MTDEIREELMEMMKLDRRRRNNFQQWGLIIAMVVQFGTFVWQASKMAATVEAQQVWQQDFRNNLTSLTTSVASLATQVAVNSSNIATITRVVDGIKR